MWTSLVVSSARRAASGTTSCRSPSTSSIVDCPQDFEWGVWVSLSVENYERWRAEALAAMGLHPEERSVSSRLRVHPMSGGARSAQALEGWYGTAAEAGLAGAVMELALLLRDRGQAASAEPFFRQAADAGIVEAGAEAPRGPGHAVRLPTSFRAPTPAKTKST